MAGQRTALITGCSSGIGKATASRLAGAGWTVFATARRPETLADLTNCRHLALDVTDEASMSEAVDAMLAEVGQIDALVNNAGYSLSGAVETLDIADLRRQFETNVFGLVRLTQLVLPSMRERGQGRIVNIGSMGGKLTFPGGGAYHATKYAVEALSDAMRFELAGFGINVVLIEPGLITTNFDDAALSSMDLEAEGPYASFNRAVAKATADAYAGPLAKFGGPPESVAAVVEKALTKRNPKPRYTVTLSAPTQIGMRKVLGDRGWDLAMRAVFPQPRPNKN